MKHLHPVPALALPAAAFFSMLALAGCGGGGEGADAGGMDAVADAGGGMDAGMDTDAGANAGDAREGGPVDAGPVCVRPHRPADGGVGADAGAALACNGSPLLCDRRYNEVAYPTAHNAMSNADDGWSIPNQEHGIPRALADGVRGLMLDLHYYGNGTTPYLCHANCALGKRKLVDGLCDIVNFLDENPGEVVSIQFETYITDADTAAAFEATGLIDYVHTQPRDAPWPTLREMIGMNHRMVVFVETGGGDPPWLHPLFDYSWETAYHFETASEFEASNNYGCAPNRGTMGNPLFTLNHFLTNPVADPSNAQMVNFNPLFINRAQACQAFGGQIPNFVAVDFYSIGDLLSVVNTLNGVP